MMPALQTVRFLKGLQQMKTEKVEEMYIPATWGKHVGIPWLSPQDVVPPCLAIRKQQMGIAADQGEERGMESVICIHVQRH